MGSYWVSPKAKLALQRAIERGGPMPVLHRSKVPDPSMINNEVLYVSIPNEEVDSGEWEQLVWLAF